jgi:hypothetical protein
MRAAGDDCDSGESKRNTRKKIHIVLERDLDTGELIGVVNAFVSLREAKTDYPDAGSNEDDQYEIQHINLNE